MPGRINIVIKQGAVFRMSRRWVLADPDDPTLPDPDLTPVPFDYDSARAHIRQAQQATEGLVELSSDDDEVTFDPLTGLIEIYIPATKTALLDSKKMYYDVELVPVTGEADVVCPFEGVVKVLPNYTQEPGEVVVE